MEKNYPIMGKIAIALILAFLAIYLPFIPVKILFVGAAGILFALCFKKFKVLLIIFFILALLIMGGIYTAIEYFHNFELPWFMSSMGNMNFGMNFEQNMRLVLPEIEVDTEENLVIRGNSLRLDFIEDLKRIQYPSGMIERRDENSNGLTLDGGPIRGNRTLVIQIPSDVDYTEITVNADAVSMNGTIRAQEVKINVDALNMQGTYIVDHLKVQSDAANFKGILDGVDFVFSADAMNFSGEVQKLKYFEIASEVLNGNLKFLSGWEESRVVELKATFGKFSVQRPRNQPSKLSVNHKGELFNVDVEEY